MTRESIIIGNRLENGEKAQMRKDFFTQGCGDVLGSLPQRTIEPQSSRIFKRGIDRFLDIEDIDGYGEQCGESNAEVDQPIISMNG